MAVTQWCWRCRADVVMLEPDEWALIQEAGQAGQHYLDVLERERDRVPGRRFTPLPDNASPADKRRAYIVLGYELVTGRREYPGRIKEHHQTALYGPPCETCGKPLRTPHAHLCAACGTVRSDRTAIPHPRCTGERVRLHFWPLRSLDDVLIEPLPPERGERTPIGEKGRRFLDALAEVMLIGRRAQPLSDFPELARMAVVLQHVHLMVWAEKTIEILEGEDGDALPHVAAWCRVIGAQRFWHSPRSSSRCIPPSCRTTRMRDRST